MSRRRKKTPAKSPPTTAHRPAQEPVDSPFALAEQQLRETVRRTAKPTPPPKPDTPAPVPAESDSQLLARYYHGVKPVRNDDRVAPPPPPAPRVPPGDDNDTALAALSDIVDGKGDFDIEFLDEFVTGLAPGVDRRLLDQLKKGDFAVQDHLDLHGFTWAEAREEILGFVSRAIGQQKRCILIIHGRGLHSRTPVPALREGLLALLTRGPLRKRILAFCTARPVDGGPGSMYLLLRRNRGNLVTGRPEPEFPHER